VRHTGRCVDDLGPNILEREESRDLRIRPTK
jgi:hypothetical protein